MLKVQFFNIIKYIIHSSTSNELKIHNSYGKTWQKANNNGWVVADDILSALIGGSKNKIDKARMSWISKSVIN